MNKKDLEALRIEAVKRYVGEESPRVIGKEFRLCENQQCILLCGLLYKLKGYFSHSLKNYPCPNVGSLNG